MHKSAILSLLLSLSSPVFAAGFEARNAGQHWLTRFDGRGFTVEPDRGGWKWGLALERYGFPGSERPVTSPATARKDGDTVRYEWSGGVAEWFVNGADGVEHGFTIHERPAGGSGPLRLTLSVRGGLTPRVFAGGQGAMFFAEGGPAALSYTKLRSWDADGRDLPSRMEPSNGELSLVVETAGARFPVTVDPIAQQAYVKASNPDAEDNFGWSIAMSGDTVVVGAPGEDGAGNTSTDSGAAYVFVKSGGAWIQQAYLKASDSGPGFRFGISVAIDGDTLVVGAERARETISGFDAQVGAVYVFVRSAGVWTQQAKLTGSNSNGLDSFGFPGGDFFGRSVSVSGDTLVVGAPEEDSNGTGVNSAAGNDNSARNSGAAYVFLRSGATWTQEAYLKASNTASLDYFGSSVAISGNTIAVGAPKEAEFAPANAPPGTVYVFIKTGGVWTQQAALTPASNRPRIYFGQAVALDGDTLAVHAPDDPVPSRGGAYVFARSGAAWIQQAELPLPEVSGIQSRPDFVGAISLSGNRLVVGAMRQDRAYLFDRAGTTWSFLGTIQGSNVEASDGYGKSVAISGTQAAIGAFFESSNGSGVNPNSQNNNSLTRSGAAYILTAIPSGMILSGSGQSVAAGSPFPQPLQVTVRDAQGNPVTGAVITFTPPGSGPSAVLSAPTATTNAQGVAAVTATANLVAGSYNVTASMPGDSALFALTNTAMGTPALLNPANGSTVRTINEFRWSAVPGATSYNFRLKPANSAQVFRVSIPGSFTSVVYTQPDGAYRWEMEACNTVGCGATAVSNFTISTGPPPSSPPQLLSCGVTNDNGQNRLDCNWSANFAADYHFIDVVQPGAGPGGGALTVAGGQAGTTFSSPIPNGAATVLLRGCTGNGCGPFAPGINITPSFGNPGVPILSQPFGGSTLDFGNNAPLVTFAWSRVAGDTGSNVTYRLYVQDFSRNRPALDVLTTNNFYGAYLNPATRYDALVIATPNGGAAKQGPASPFLVKGRAPGAVVVSEPTYNSTIVRDNQGRARIAWTPILNDDGSQATRSYEYFVSGPAGTRTGTTTELFADVALPAGTYDVIVRACVTGGACGPWNNGVGSEGGPGRFTAQ